MLSSVLTIIERKLFYFIGLLYETLIYLLAE